MCGIAGLLSREPGDARVRAMLARLVHRGPDGEGVWSGEHDGARIVLGHRRLAILDIEGGAQPMASHDGHVHVTYNGEIYNFRELRHDLERIGVVFRTRSDTEVLANAIAHWGEGAIERLNGMFAFAAWDSRSGDLLLARDRAGVKPLYFALLEDGGVAFASELTALLGAWPRTYRLSPGGLLSYFFSDYAHPPWTLIDGVEKLAPGSTLRLHLGEKAVFRRFWSVPRDARDAGPPDARAQAALAEELWSKLGQAVERQLVADVPVGVFLSGGLDSSSIAALASERYPRRLQTFSIGFDEPSFDESGYARAVAAQLGSEHVEERLRMADMLALIDTVLGAADEPTADHSILPTYLVARLAARHVKVVLGGDGADELFGGYPTYRAHRAARVYRRLPSALRSLLARGVEYLPSTDTYMGRSRAAKRFAGRFDDSGPRRHLRWMSNTDLDELGRLLPWIKGEEPATLAVAAAISDDLASILGLDFQTYLPGSVLAKLDRATMAHGLEARPPMLDNDVVDFAQEVPIELKVGLREGKRILRQAARAHVPAAVIARRKQGFSVPLAAWLRGPLRSRLSAILLDSPLWHRRCLDRATVDRMARAHFDGQGDHEKTLWAVIVLDHFVRKESVHVA